MFMRILKKCRHLFLALLAIPLVLLMRILSPLVTVRIYRLGIFKIGCVLSHLDTFVCRRKAGLNEPRTIDFCCFGEREICNAQVKKNDRKKNFDISFCFLGRCSQ